MYPLPRDILHRVIAPHCKRSIAIVKVSAINLVTGERRNCALLFPLQLRLPRESSVTTRTTMGVVFSWIFSRIFLSIHKKHIYIYIYRSEAAPEMGYRGGRLIPFPAGRKRLPVDGEIGDEIYTTPCRVPVFRSDASRIGGINQEESSNRFSLYMAFKSH